MNNIFLIETKIRELKSVIEKARKNLKTQLNKKNIDFLENYSLRKLISLIPLKYSNPINLSNPRKYHTAVKVGLDVLISGGINNPNNILQVLYNNSSNTFTTKANLTNPKYQHTAVKINDNNILFSGGGGGSSVSESMQILYNIESDTFTTKANLPRGRYFHTAIKINNNILFSGGTSSYGGTNIPNPASMQTLYNIESDTFTENPKLPTSRHSHTGENISEGIIFSGGINNDDGILKRQTLYNIESNTFTTKANLPTPRMEHTSIIINKNILFSGSSDNYTNAAEDSRKTQTLYNIESDTFTTKANLPETKNGHTAINIYDNILISGGGNYVNTNQKKQYLYLYNEDKFLV